VVAAIGRILFGSLNRSWNPDSPGTTDLMQVGFFKLSGNCADITGNALFVGVADKHGGP
jgi:hypothetical protein